LINGSSIRKHSIPGNRLERNTVTGAQIKESSLGKVPAARKADRASSATSAANATHASNATSVSSVRVFGPTGLQMGTNSHSLIAFGPFTVLGSCDTHGGSDLYADVTLITSEAHSTAAGKDDSSSDFGPGDSVSIDDTTSSGGPPATSGGNNNFVAMAPSGKALTGNVQSWTSLDDDTCTWQGSLIVTG
jgi:hypothetical protein